MRPSFAFFTSIFLSQIVLAWSIAFISPSAVTYRAFAFAVAVCLTLPLYSLSSSVSENRVLGAVLVSAMWIQLLRSIDTLFLNARYYAASTAERNVPGKRGRKVSGSSRQNNATRMEFRACTDVLLSSWDRYCAAMKSLWDMRDVGRDQPIQKVHRLPKQSHWAKISQPGSHREFLLRRCATVFLKYLILELLAFSPPPKPEDFEPAKELFFLRLNTMTAEEVLIRVLSTVGFWLNTYLFVSVLYDILSLLHVLLGIDTPAAWPSPFGSISDAYSVRQFWGYVLLLFQQ